MPYTPNPAHEGADPHAVGQPFVQAPRCPACGDYTFGAGTHHPECAPNVECRAHGLLTLSADGAVYECLKCKAITAKFYRTRAAIEARAAYEATTAVIDAATVPTLAMRQNEYQASLRWQATIRNL